MGDSWSVGAWHDSNCVITEENEDQFRDLLRMATAYGWTDDQMGQNQVYHRGISQFLEDQGHSVELLGLAGSHNITQFRRMRDSDDHAYDLIVWLWTDCIREYDWYQRHQRGIHNLYDIHRATEQWVIKQINEWRPDLWDRMVMIGGNAPLMLDWPCTQLSSWCSEMGHIWIDHPTVDPVNWRDFVNWCNGRLTIGKEDYADSPQFTHVHQMWDEFIRSFSHSHKQHHMDFLQRSHDRMSLLVYGAEHDAWGKGMMGHDLHPNPLAHEWLTQWILSNK